jgi:hypothetical protein
MCGKSSHCNRIINRQFRHLYMGKTCESSPVYWDCIVRPHTHAMWTQTEQALDNRARKDAPPLAKVVVDLLVLIGIIWLTLGYWKPAWEKVWMMPGASFQSNACPGCPGSHACS